MYIESKKITKQYQRTSKQGILHAYSRTSTMLIFTCDNCGAVIERSKGQIDPRRVNNEYYHVCANCSPKQFAQTKGVERRRIWNMPVDSDIRI
jgi:predicted RNA-binding Zn-ribbon protein involved in translation (DUF1610 family)